MVPAYLLGLAYICYYWILEYIMFTLLFILSLICSVEAMADWLTHKCKLIDSQFKIDRLFELQIANSQIAKLAAHNLHIVCLAAPRLSAHQLATRKLAF